jgi:hypothetical protein
MGNPDSRRRGYVLAGLLGAIGGGLFVALATRAVPKVISHLMSETMQHMMSEGGEGACDPAEM